MYYMWFQAHQKKVLEATCGLYKNELVIYYLVTIYKASVNHLTVKM